MAWTIRSFLTATKVARQCLNYSTQLTDLSSIAPSTCELSRSELHSLLVSLDDTSVSVDSCNSLVSRLETHPNSKAFWSQLLSLTNELNKTKLHSTLCNFVLSSIEKHNNSSILAALKFLTSEGRFSEMEQLFQNLCNRLTAAENVVLAPQLIEILSMSPAWYKLFDWLPYLSSEHAKQNALKMASLGAIRFDSFDKTIAILEQLPILTGIPEANFFKFFLDKLSMEKKTDSSDTYLSNLLQLVGRKQWILSAETAQQLADWFEKCSTLSWIPELNAQVKGVTCSCCGDKLSRLSFTKDEIATMASEFYQLAFQGVKADNVYLTTTPEELKSLGNFLSDQTAPFDCVVDFLNLVHFITASRDPNVITSAVCQALQTLNRRLNIRRFCLVAKPNRLLRSAKFWNAIRTLGTQTGISVFSFITNRSSIDDVFSIYLALWSGPNCYLLSQDEFKQHRFTVGSSLATRLRRWQASRQLCLMDRRKLFLDPIDCETKVLGSMETGWHIPYDNGFQRISFRPPSSWLCVKRIP